MTQKTQNPASPAPDPETQIPEDNEIPEENESREGLCPYFVRERSPGILSCECARMKFPDRDSRREIVYRYCAHPQGYKACMLKQALDHYYERKYARHE